MTDKTRTALIGIIVEDTEAIDKGHIIGRMGVPHPSKEISIISIALDASDNIISALAGKLGALQGVTTKTIYSKV